MICTTLAELCSVYCDIIEIGDVLLKLYRGSSFLAVFIICHVIVIVQKAPIKSTPPPQYLAHNLSTVQVNLIVFCANVERLH